MHILFIPRMRCPTIDICPDKALLRPEQAPLRPATVISGASRQTCSGICHGNEECERNCAHIPSSFIRFIPAIRGSDSSSFLLSIACPSQHILDFRRVHGYLVGMKFRHVSAFSPSRAARMQTALVRFLSSLHLYRPLKGAADRLAALSPAHAKRSAAPFNGR